MNEPPGFDDWFPLGELTERVAALVWVESTVAEILTAWSGVEPDTRSRLAFHVAARHHAWHAEVLTGCLATSEQLADLTEPRPPTAGWAAAAERFAGLLDPARTTARLLVLVREIDPWLARETAALLDVANPLSDAPLIRWLRFIELDHRVDGEGPAAALDALRTNTVSLEDRAALAGIDLTATSGGAKNSPGLSAC